MAETEKITININVVDLGKIDLLVDEGFYTNRTDFIRTAIRKELHEQKTYIEESITRHHKMVGLIHFGEKELEPYRQRGEMLDIQVVGYLNIGKDVTPDLAEATIRKLRVQGVLTMPTNVGMRLKDLERMRQ